MAATPAFGPVSTFVAFRARASLDPVGIFVAEKLWVVRPFPMLMWPPMRLVLVIRLCVQGPMLLCLLQ